MSLGFLDLSCWNIMVGFSSAEARQHVWDDLVSPRSCYGEIFCDATIDHFKV